MLKCYSGVLVRIKFQMQDDDWIETLKVVKSAELVEMQV